MHIDTHTIAQLNTQLHALTQAVERLAAAHTHAAHIAPPDTSGPTLAWRYRRRAGQALGQLQPVREAALVKLDDLAHINAQKAALVTNTAHFLAGRPANNALLTGARGTGKSSLVKACLHAFAAQGLRLVEVDKDDLGDLTDIVDALAQRPQSRFIVYCDDLSFEAGEGGYKALKTVLDGSVAASAPNVLVYASSNRRHLMPESMGDNLQHTRGPSDEIHPGEAVEEKIALADRFGLWLSFYPFAQEEYWDIAHAALRRLGVDEATAASARQPALVWATQRGARSARLAEQFARHWAAQYLAGHTPASHTAPIADVPHTGEGAGLD